MGRHKRGFNANARQIVSGKLVDEADVKKLRDKVQFPKQSDTEYKSSQDDTNALILPSKKRQFKKSKESLNVPAKLLSKKKRKILQRIVDEKRKKAERGKLLEKLGQVQVDDSHLSKMTSLSQVQTKGLKRQIAEDEWLLETETLENKPGEMIDLEKVKLLTGNPVKKPKLKKMLVQKEKSDPNILGFSESSSEGEEEEEEEEEDEEKMIEENVNEDEQKNEENSDEGKTSDQQSEGKNVEAPTTKGPLLKEKVLPKTNPQIMRKTQYVSVKRRKEVQEGREKLPIVAEEQAIMEAITENLVVVLSGATGSGKTTQVPQFLYEAGFTSNGQIIGITEPRRVAAMSMSKRVGYELDMPHKVSYQIRFDGNVSSETEIKFMTDGVLLRELSKDFKLSKYSVIIIDEAHERSVYTDILIGNLSRIVPLREKDPNLGPLRLIIMSATLRVADFTENSHLFKTVPPCINVESRQFETTCHFQKTTPDDYLASALKKICKIHRELPEGGVLVFVTGQQEVNILVRKLRKLFPSKKYQQALNKSDDDEDEEETIEREMQKALKKVKRSKRNDKKENEKELSSVSDSSVDLNKYCVLPLDETESDAKMSSDKQSSRDDLALDEEEQLFDDSTFDEVSLKGACNQPMWTLPLYSLLNADKQSRIFEPVPNGHRLCVVSTNIAETSLTIPGIKYVVDTGKVKTKFYDRLTGVTTFQVTWTSKASANQRAGRAGRLGPGHCYRLYSSEVYKNSFPEHNEPEILKKPIDDLVLQMKAMKLLNVSNFPFPTPPDATQLSVAEQKLVSLGALRFDANRKLNVITELGKSMAAFPVAPSFAKMLALSDQHSLMPYSITLVAVLTVQEVLMEAPIGGQATCFSKEEIAKIRKIWAGSGNTFLLGDPMILIKAVCSSESDSTTSLEDFCTKYALRYKAMAEIRKLRRQLTNEVNAIIPSSNLVLDPKLRPPNDSQALLLRQILLAGMTSNVARRIEEDDEEAKKAKRKKIMASYKCGCLEEPVQLHNSSLFVLASKVTKQPPDWVVFQEVFETSNGKMQMRGVTAIEPEWLPIFAESQCRFMPPLPDPEPWYSNGKVMCKMQGTFGTQAWPLPLLDMPYPETKDGMRIKYFARFLLEGQVLDKLGQFRDTLLCQPSTFTRSTVFHGAAVKAFLTALADNNVFCMDSLKAAFSQNGKFLLNEYKKMQPQSRHATLDEIWPQLL